MLQNVLWAGLCNRTDIGAASLKAPGTFVLRGQRCQRFEFERGLLGPTLPNELTFFFASTSRPVEDKVLESLDIFFLATV